MPKNEQDTHATSLTAAYRIMGKRYHPPERTKKLLERMDLGSPRALRSVPFSKELLERCCHDFWLFPDFGLSVNELRTHLYICDASRGDIDAWLDEAMFANKTEAPCWKLMRWKFRDVLRPGNEPEGYIHSTPSTRPSAREIIYALCLFGTYDVPEIRSSSNETTPRKGFVITSDRYKKHARIVISKTRRHNIFHIVIDKDNSIPFGWI